jgi:hypothetical protein
VRDRFGVLHLVAAGVDQRGDHPHRHVAPGAGGVAGGEHLDREGGAAGVVAQRVDHLAEDGAQPVGPALLAVEGDEHLPHALVVHLPPGGEEAVVLVAEVAVEGGAVEAGPLEHHRHRGLGVAALAGDLDQRLDDALALGARRALARLQVEH